MRLGLVLVGLAAVAAATEPERPAARVEFFLRDRGGIRKQRFVDAVAKALDEEGLDLKKLPYDYAKTIHGSFWYYARHFWIHKSPRPRFKDVEQAVAAAAPDEIAQGAIRGHKAWLALEASTNKDVAGDYRVLCRIAAELLGDDVLALHFPARKAWIAADADGLAKKRRAKEPLKALGIGVTEEEKEERETARVLADATKEARSRFDEFKKAFRTREKTGATTFSVTFKDPLTGKENTLSVHEIRRDRIEGLTMTRDFIDSDRVVYADRVLDWSYRVGKRHFGGFRMKALIARREKQLDK
jgi:hypothetical protein